MKGIDSNGAKRIYNPAGRNARSVWTIATAPFSGAHFATFPPELARRCIVAGSPTKVCAECGAPWERVVEVTPGYSKECPKTQAAHEARGGAGAPVGTVGKSGSGRTDPIIQTLGFRPTCDCYKSGEEKTDKAIILDPFAGSGTTLQVAHENFRHYIGLEINPDYIPLAEKRGLKQKVIF